MKRVFVLLLALCLLSCSKEGEVTNKSNGTININGKEYKFIKVVPADGERGVWLLIPSDATVELPKLISYSHLENCGKNCWSERYITVLHIQ